MALLEKQLVVQPSKIPGAGNGLYTTEFIAKGIRIIEYKGKITTWKNVNSLDGKNPYIYYVKASHVIDALNYKKSLARYINDARGLTRIKGINNNSQFVVEGVRVYVEAIKNIPAGEEILLSYSKDYWDTIKKNRKIDEDAKKAS